jgi:hypothetical protein
MRAASTQKAYDEAFLACSTAVYFESQVGAQPLKDKVYNLFLLTFHSAEQRKGSSSFMENCP